MEDISHLLLEIKKQIDTQKQDFLEMKEAITSLIDEKISVIVENYVKFEEKLNNQQQTINYLEKFIRRKNIIFFGVEEEERNYQDLENKILSILNRTMSLNFDTNCLEYVGRMGKNKNKLRPVIVTLSTVGKKIEVLKRKKALKDSKYYLQEDFTKEVLEKRKELRKNLDEQRKQGKNAFLKYDEIILKSDTQLPNYPDMKTSTRNLPPPTDMRSKNFDLKQNCSKKNKYKSSSISQKS